MTEAVIDPSSPDYKVVHTGSAGDHYRWRLPTESGFANTGRMHSQIDLNLASCQAACDNDLPSCVGLFFGGNSTYLNGWHPPVCALLTKLESTYSGYFGTSFQRHGGGRNRSSTILAQTSSPNVSLLGRRRYHQPRASTYDGDVDDALVTLHVVDWTYTQHWHSRQPTLSISLDNLRMLAEMGLTPGSSFGTDDDCANATVMQHGPGLPVGGNVVVPTSCSGGITVLKVVSPQPWTVLSFSMRTTSDLL